MPDLEATHGVLLGNFKRRTMRSSKSPLPESFMPRVFRVMKKAPDGLPMISPTSLGIRVGIDVDVDAQNDVLANGKGMSVAPDWRVINVNRIPRRLREIVPGAGGSNNTFCFRAGQGAFIQGLFAVGLTLEPDSPTHGNVTPESVVAISTFEENLAATRLMWIEEET